MLEKFKKHALKIVVIFVNGLVILAGALLIKTNEQQKNSLAEQANEADNKIETSLPQDGIVNQPYEAQVASENVTVGVQEIPSAATIAPSTAPKVATPTATTTTPKPAAVVKPAVVATPAPAPAPAPKKAAKKTKTS
jgi:outer membrane biosynthesis protein TonB